jgi:hypothetical protein
VVVVGGGVMSDAVQGGAVWDCVDAVIAMTCRCGMSAEEAGTLRLPSTWVRPSRHTF